MKQEGTDANFTPKDPITHVFDGIDIPTSFDGCCNLEPADKESLTEAIYNASASFLASAPLGSEINDLGTTLLAAVWDGKAIVCYSEGIRNEVVRFGNYDPGELPLGQPYITLIPDLYEYEPDTYRVAILIPPEFLKDAKDNSIAALAEFVNFAATVNECIENSYDYIQACDHITEIRVHALQKQITFLQTVSYTTSSNYPQYIPDIDNQDRSILN